MTVVLRRGNEELTSWPLPWRRPVGLEVVDELARLQLHARRLGCSVRLRGAGPELMELLALVGLGIEVGGEPEGGEQIGVEEVVMPDDPVA